MGARSFFLAGIFPGRHRGIFRDGKLLHEDYPDNLGVGRDEDISCANMFKIGNKWMLLCISHDLGCRYFIGDFKDGDI